MAIVSTVEEPTDFRRQFIRNLGYTLPSESDLNEEVFKKEIIEAIRKGELSKTKD